MSHSTISHTTEQSISADKAFDRFLQLMAMTKWREIKWIRADAYRGDDFRLLGIDELGDQHILRFPALSCGNNDTAIRAIIAILHHEKVGLGLGQDLDAALRNGEHVMIDS